MIYKVECLLIPESYVRITMKTSEFDRMIENEFSENDIIYQYRGARYLLEGDDCVIEELVYGNPQQC